ncbi:MAG: hypothetical protein PG981_000779 [Wolbachia endosymbiont of Ctenocephalides orientis wCori]|nr:MAG: hypothetical protein PG981_000779 [Wolbachia endosymbiont of Ctenocephalides orientis wCori]
MYTKFTLFTAFSFWFLLPAVCFSNERFESTGKGFYTRFSIGSTISDNFQAAVITHADTVHTSLSVG